MVLGTALANDQKQRLLMMIATSTASRAVVVHKADQVLSSGKALVMMLGMDVATYRMEALSMVLAAASTKVLALVW